LRIQARSRLSWYDSLIVGAAIQAECELLLTEDLQHGQRFEALQVVNPFL
jgi:predicted nucleic acid-binding protein